jgi:hypothetical protein
MNKVEEKNSSVLQEEEFHKLANFTINHLLEKIEVFEAGTFFSLGFFVLLEIAIAYTMFYLHDSCSGLW